MHQQGSLLNQLRELGTHTHIAWDDLDLASVVGHGAFGRVWKGQWKGEHIAAKQIRLEDERVVKDVLQVVVVIVFAGEGASQP